ncbi:MAG TPA: hypothetical protein VK879_20120 [Candidatus Sulfomarinibacteraceae bacterium]|nr:hypothetical protein [Candidatus Sulfomarinibacteraceae bacterium]
MLSSRKWPFIFILFAGLMCATLALAALGRRPVSAGGEGSIAYVRPNDTSGDEIRFIEPDGSGDRLIWSTGKADPFAVDAITSLAWRPDATELAFASDHEKDCSILRSDIYGVYPDGSDHRRITNAPTCEELAAYPKGTVVVEVENQTGGSGPFFIYVQGAPGLQFISVAPGAVTTVTVHDVADLGQGLLQFSAVTDANRRWWGAPVDVQAGATVEAPRLVLGEGLLEFGADWPTWRSDGSRIGYVVGLGTPYHIEANPGLLELGDLLLDGQSSALFVDLLTWSPAAANANQLLYGGSGFAVDLSEVGVFRIYEGSPDPGEVLVSPSEVWHTVTGLAWLPDGSGFIFAMSEDTFIGEKADIFEYSFSTGQATRLTDFSTEFAYQLSVSPDGQRIVFERVTELLVWEDPQVDLWIMNRDGSGQRLLVENGRAPAWSPGEIQSPPSPTPTPTPTQPPPPPGLDARNYLPFVSGN